MGRGEKRSRLERVCTDSIMTSVCVSVRVLGGNEGHIWDRELALVNQSEKGNILSWAPGTRRTRRAKHTHTHTHSDPLDVCTANNIS